MLIVSALSCDEIKFFLLISFLCILIAKNTPYVVYKIFSRFEGCRGMKIIKIAEKIMFMESLNILVQIIKDLTQF